MDCGVFLFAGPLTSQNRGIRLIGMEMGAAKIQEWLGSKVSPLDALNPAPPYGHPIMVIQLEEGTWYALFGGSIRKESS